MAPSSNKAETESGCPLRNNLQKIKNGMFEHGLHLSVEFSNGFANTIPFPDDVVLDDDVVMLRKASEDIRPGFPNVLRIIVCPMDLIRFGATFRNKSIGAMNFKPFILLNSRMLDQSEATLLHEMIHAAYPGPKDHDPEPHSIFFSFGTTELGKTGRTFLKPEHAATMGKSSSLFEAILRRLKEPPGRLHHSLSACMWRARPRPVAGTSKAESPDRVLVRQGRLRCWRLGVRALGPGIRAHERRNIVFGPGAG